jgi:hypothetical protein
MSTSKTPPETAVTPATPANVPALADTNWDEVQWVTVVEEAGTQIVFDTTGDAFVGMFTGKRIAQNDDEDFTILSFRGTDGQAYQTNAGWKLREGFSDITPGTIVRIEYVKDVKIPGQPSDMKDFRIQVASGQ